jgi:hypothetical protein
MGTGHQDLLAGCLKALVWFYHSGKEGERHRELKCFES